jgi:tetratricopeptide (TPR) repeat protein
LNAPALYNLGNAYFMKQDYEKSINAYTLALKLNPDSAECHFNIASAMRDNQQFKEAELHYETSIKLNKTNPETFY